MKKLLRPTTTKRIAFFVTGDILLSIASLYGAYLLRFNFDIPVEFMAPFPAIALTLILLKLLLIHVFHNYRIIWRFYGLEEAKKLLFALAGAYLLFVLIYLALDGFFAPFPRSVVIIDFLLSLITLGGLRLLKRLALGFLPRHKALQPTLLVGISPNTANLIKSTLEGESPYYPVAVAAVQGENRNMIGGAIQNLPIVGSETMRDVIERYRITAAILDASLPLERVRECYRLLTEAGIAQIKRSALLADGGETIAPLSVEELLVRHPKDLDSATIERFIRGKKILITGAGGSIGSEIALQCRRFGAKKLILVDNSEYSLYRIGELLPESELHLLNVADRAAVETLMRETLPDILIHAAAYKHVPLCEANPHAAAVNNVAGSRSVIDAAVACNVPKIVIVSTDKAVRPTNVMGATKRVVELYAQNVDPKNSEIVSVRFGNVLGSSGSVIPKFKAQIEAGGPVTITHPEITRYFMLIGEACQLVLQAAAIARGGELFILDMGEPVKIQTLAETMIHLYATRPIEIVYTGLRPGEKLYEELLIDESERQTAFESIMIARSTRYPIDELTRDIDALEHTDDVVAGLQKIVPEFEHAKYN